MKFYMAIRHKWNCERKSAETPSQIPLSNTLSKNTRAYRRFFTFPGCVCTWDSRPGSFALLTRKKKFNKRAHVQLSMLCYIQHFFPLLTRRNAGDPREDPRVYPGRTLNIIFYPYRTLDVILRTCPNCRHSRTRRWTVLFN